MNTVPSATPPSTSTFPWWTTAAWPCRATRTSSCNARPYELCTERILFLREIGTVREGLVRTYTTAVWPGRRFLRVGVQC